MSVYAGLRPLVKVGDSKTTAALSRDHTILISNAGLLTIAGGKWTTYRKMARTVEDVLSRRTRALLLGARASIEAAPRVAELMAKELKQDTDWQKKTVQNFQEVAQGYLPPK